MSVERPYNDQFAMAELVVGQNLHTAVRATPDGEVAVLTRAQEFTATSVIEGLSRALDGAVDLASRMRRVGGQVFDADAFRARWLPGERTVAAIREQHRPHLRYLSGVAGVRAFYESIISGSRTFDEPHYDHQVEAYRVSATYLEANDPFAESNPGAYHELAGGSGKSRIIAELTAAFKSQEDREDPNRVLVITPDLAVQAELLGADGRDGFGKYAPHLDIGVMNKDTKEIDKEVIIATTNMVRSMLKADPHALERFDLIVGDEAHTLLGEITQRVLTGIRRQIIGVTGSARLVQKKVADLLPERLTQRGTREMIEAGQLAPVQTWICKTGLVTHQEAGRREYTAEELRRIASMPERHQIALDAGRAFFRDNRNGVFICGTIEEAKKIAQAATGSVPMPDGSSRQVKVVAVTSQTKDYHEIFKALNNNEIQGVAIVGIDTGWNAPAISFEVTIAPSSSEAKARQRAARLSRRCYDVNGNLITSQYFELMDIIRRRGGEKAEILNPTRQITVPELLGETEYHAGQVIASPDSEGQRRDFSIGQFPPHIRRGVSMPDGVNILLLPIFGAGVIRERRPSPAGYVSIEEAAVGLGTTVRAVMRAVRNRGIQLRDGRLITTGKEDDSKGSGGDLDKVARYLIDHGDPII